MRKSSDKDVVLCKRLILLLLFIVIVFVGACYIAIILQHKNNNVSIVIECIKNDKCIEYVREYNVLPRE